MRDITRGGIATILAEIATGGKFGIQIEEEYIPIREQVNGLCEIYGFNPLYLANEGKVLMIVPGDSAGRAVEIMKQFDTGRDACIIGSVSTGNPGKVIMKSVTGGTRLIDKLAGEQLPRIC
jgi:hydrogenase expression/formation protein HypE